MISQSFLVLTQISSTYACGETPFSAALRSIFWPCSSRPVRKNVSYPCRRLKRARVSVAVVQ